ncbi:MAG TPA: hypothetical protein VF808_06120 [Ktedonobacterales bacterium]
MDATRLSFARVAIAELVSLVVAGVGLFLPINIAVYALIIPYTLKPFWLHGVLVNLITLGTFLLPLLLGQAAGLTILWIAERREWRLRRLSWGQRLLAGGIVGAETFVVVVSVLANTMRGARMTVLALSDFAFGLCALMFIACLAMAWAGKRWGWMILLLLPALVALSTYPMAFTTGYSPAFALFQSTFYSTFYAAAAATLLTGLAFALFGLSRGAGQIPAADSAPLA